MKGKREKLLEGKKDVLRGMLSRGAREERHLLQLATALGVALEADGARPLPRAAGHDPLNSLSIDPRFGRGRCHLGRQQTS